MNDDTWLGSIADITALVADEHDIPLSVLSAEGLATRDTHKGLDESQNLRLLRLSVAEFQSGLMSQDEYETHVYHVMDVACTSWKALRALPGQYSFQDKAAASFEHLHQACEQMLEQPDKGLNEAVSAYRRIDQLELELKEVLDQAA
jgi:hypothetical protein